MNIRQINSFEELDGEVSTLEKSFLLLYKGGTEQSECAYNLLNEMEGGNAIPVFSADVNEVRDIHSRLQVTSAPSLVVFDQGKVQNIIKGCQTESAYESILSGREMGSISSENKKSKQVTVYTTPTCSWCTTLKTYLKEQHISFREINVAADTAAAERMVSKSGQQGVPQTEISGQMIVGFDKNRINQLLQIN